MALTRTIERDLQTCLVRAPWAVKELVADQKLQEANQLYGRCRMFGYLRGRLGSENRALACLRASIHSSGKGYIWPERAGDRKGYVLRVHFWAVEELVYRCKMEEAVEVLKSRQRALKFLSSRYGGTQELVRKLRWCSMNFGWRSGDLKEIRDSY